MPEDDRRAETSPCSHQGSAEPPWQKIFCQGTYGKTHSKVWLAGQGQGGQPGPLLLSAHSLHWSWDSPPALHPHIPAEPGGTLPATPVPGSTGGLGTARHSSRTGPASPRRSSACSAQSTPAAGKPLHTRGNSAAPRRRPARIYTSSMTTPLPLALPTGCDFQRQFPPTAGGRAGNTRFDTHPSPLQGHTTTLQLRWVLL